MGDRSKIEWTRGDDGTPGATWNPVTGCDKVSAGCDNCYAESIAHRFAGGPAYPDGFAVTLRPERLEQPLRWRRPRRVFVNSMSDLFHDQIQDEYIASVFAIMALAPQHTFQVLTKRHGRMRSLLSSASFAHQVAEVGRARFIGDQQDWLRAGAMLGGNPLPNVWLGVSTEDQRWANIRIPALLTTPAAVRFISAEPLLGPIDLEQAVATMGSERGHRMTAPFVHVAGRCRRFHGIDWVIVGGESGPRARPMHPDWARSLRDQCARAGVAFHFKQWGEFAPESTGAPNSEDDALDGPASGQMRRVGKGRAGRELDGRTWSQFPTPVDASAGDRL